MIHKLPYELVSIIFQYDNTYVGKYKKCINELNEYFNKEFPNRWVYHQHYYNEQGERETIIKTSISKSQLNNLHNFIYNRCKRKKSLRSYRTKSF